MGLLTGSSPVGTAGNSYKGLLGNTQYHMNLAPVGIPTAKKAAPAPKPGQSLLARGLTDIGHFGKGVAVGTNQDVIQPLHHAVVSQVKHLAGPTSAQAERDAIVKNQQTAQNNPAYQKAIKGKGPISISQSIVAQAHQNDPNLPSLINKQVAALHTQNNQRLSSAVQLSTLALPLPSIAGVKAVARGVGASRSSALAKSITDATKEATHGAPVIHLPDKGIYAKLSTQQQAHLADEVKNLKSSSGDIVHLSQPGHVGTAKEVPLSELKAQSPNATKSLAAVSKPKEPSVSLNQAPGSDLLPTGSTKQASLLQKAYLSSTGLIAKQGKAGTQLAKSIGKARNAAEIFQASVVKRLPTVTSLGKKDFPHFVDVVEGKAVAKSPKIEQAAKEWRAVAPEIRQRAVKAGIDVGDLGPNYFPHYHDYDKLFKDKNAYNAAINHLVTTGQAKTADDAVKQLSFARGISRNRTIGNLDKARIFDLPGYAKDKNALLKYISGSAHNIGQAEHLGVNDKKGLKLITQIARENGDAETAKKAYDVAVGALQHNQSTSKVSAALRGFQGVTKLGKGAITNATQPINTVAVSGYHRALGGFIKQFTPQGKDFISKTGVVGDAVIHDLSEGAGFDNKWIRRIGAPGFNTVEKSNRSLTALAGRSWANSLAKKGGPRQLAVLRDKLGVEGPIGKTLTEEQQVQAARSLVEKTQFKVSPQDLPMWASSPAGKLVAQFRTFSYKQTGFVTNEILKPLKSGNVVPLARLLAALPVGYGTMTLKNKLSGRPNESNPEKRALAIWQNIGGGGLPVDIPTNILPKNQKYVQSGAYSSRVASQLGGPTVGDAFNLTDALGQAATGQRRDLEHYGVNKVPVVGPYLANKFTPYKKSVATDQKTATDKVNKTLLKGDTSGAKQTAEAYNKQVTKTIMDNKRAYSSDELKKALDNATIKTTDQALKSRATRAKTQQYKDTHGGQAPPKVVAGGRRSRSTGRPRR